MHKKEFLLQLNKKIHVLSEGERKDIVHDYEEHFAAAKEEGKTESEIAEALGSPDKLAKEILAMYHVSVAESKTTTGNILRAVWAGIGLGFLNLILVLGPVLAIVGVVIAGWLTSVLLALTPILVPINIILFPGTFLWNDVFIMLISSGIGIFLFIGMYYVTSVFTKGLLYYLKWNVSLVKGGIKQ